MSTTNEPTPPRCGEEDCQDGQRWDPPMQEGALGAAYPCPECARLADAFWRGYRSKPSEPVDDWLHLKQYGYAPGGYMSKCHRCGATPIMDKRAVTCRPCAEAMHKERA